MADHVVTIGGDAESPLPPPPPYTPTPPENHQEKPADAHTIDSSQALVSLKKILGDTKQFIFSREQLGVRLVDSSSTSSSSGEGTLLVMTLLKNFRNLSAPLENGRFVTGVTRFCAASGTMPYLQLTAEESEEDQSGHKRLVTIFDKVGGILGTVHDLTPPSPTTVMEVRDKRGQPIFRVVELQIHGVDQNGAPVVPGDDGDRTDTAPTYNFIQVKDGLLEIVGSMWKNGGGDGGDDNKVNLKLSSSSLDDNIETKALIVAGAHVLYQEKFSKFSTLSGQQSEPIVVLGFWDQQFGRFLYWFCWCFAIFWFIMVALVAFNVIKIV